MSPAPSFVLSGPGGTLVAHGIQTAYPEIGAAQTAPRSGTLSTPISARLRESFTTALDLALALHPTPAVGGVPTEAAGWCDRNGDGRWVVSIRCAVLSQDRRRAHAYSGGGIVADSDVDDEIAETTTKFMTILSALGAA